MKNIPSVHELRKAGFAVKMSHHRRFFRFDPFTGKKHTVTVPFHIKTESFNDYFLDPMGGETHVIITKKDSNEEGVLAHSVCSVNDHYNRKVGMKKALARALSRM